MVERLLEAVSDPIWWVSVVLVSMIVGLLVNFASMAWLQPWWERRSETRRERAADLRRALTELEGAISKEPEQVVMLLQLATIYRIQGLAELFLAMLVGFIFLPFALEIVVAFPHWYTVVPIGLVAVLLVNIGVAGERKIEGSMRLTSAVVRAMPRESNQ